MQIIIVSTSQQFFMFVLIVNKKEAIFKLQSYEIRQQQGSTF